MPALGSLAGASGSVPAQAEPGAAGTGRGDACLSCAVPPVAMPCVPPCGPHPTFTGCPGPACASPCVSPHVPPASLRRPGSACVFARCASCACCVCMSQSSTAHNLCPLWPPPPPCRCWPRWAPCCSRPHSLRRRRGSQAGAALCCPVLDTWVTGILTWVLATSPRGPYKSHVIGYVRCTQL